MAVNGKTQASAAYPTVYGFWTNKGGVGKTTLTFHMATTYAELFPDKEVVAIDMCPQSNLSATLLTNTQSHRRGEYTIAVTAQSVMQVTLCRLAQATHCEHARTACKHLKQS